LEERAGKNMMHIDDQKKKKRGCRSVKKGADRKSKPPKIDEVVRGDVIFRPQRRKVREGLKSGARGREGAPGRRGRKAIIFTLEE